MRACFVKLGSQFTMLGMVVLFVACQDHAKSPNVASSSAVAPVGDSTPPAASTESSATETPPATEDMCALVTADQVQQITGMTYDTMTTQGNFPNIKHCEYRGREHVVSLVLASATTATERMTRNQALPHSAIAGFQDMAIWEPVQNMLSVMSGGRLVEVRISKSHGDEANRIAKAKALALLVLSH